MPLNSYDFFHRLARANIKIGKAHRFDRQQDIHPGPGNYELESEFSRHAFK
jgi:hypothetical protein